MRFFHCHHGVAAVEMAIIFPILICIYIFTYEIANIYSFSKRITRVAGSIGDIVAQENSINNRYLDNFSLLAKATMYPYSYNSINHKISIKIVGYWIDDRSVIHRKWFWSSDKSSSSNCKIPDSMIDNSVFIVCSDVSGSYPYTIFPKDFSPSYIKDIKINRTFYYRQRLGEIITCYDCIN
ncbi:TadE/TadG family type IV pilus assembly protein [Candidatus Liberibacter americanus]|uniref:TadE/TadG family type IV pilus assembly protein n=1 Tax=Candidatus Liberibacter americanus TaxID=309868 RepID=UPI0002C5FA0E|nr:TadE/TadG family type IV pilus assembly protein [Candidatus Liberibacter americanus]EMS36610.1 hypothetical protein G653_00145 [Candidatus Liberibacter americanus PW_SP]